MTLHLQWMKFRKIALQGKSKAEIDAIKPIFYAGLTAAMFELKDILGLQVGKSTPNSNKAQRAINARFTELDEFKRRVEVNSMFTKERNE